MSLNRLFLFDPETNEAVCIAKGYTTGWITGDDHVDMWLNKNPEYNPGITRLRLKTETDLPQDAKVVWKSST